MTKKRPRIVSTISNASFVDHGETYTVTGRDNRGVEVSITVQKYGGMFYSDPDDAGPLRISRKTDCEKYVVRAMFAQENGDDRKALDWLAKARTVYRIAEYNEARGHRDDRRAGSSGRRPIDVDKSAINYARSLPDTGGGRGHKSRWTLAAEKFHPDAGHAAIAKIARHLRSAASTKK